MFLHDCCIFSANGKREDEKEECKFFRHFIREDNLKTVYVSVWFTILMPTGQNVAHVNPHSFKFQAQIQKKTILKKKKKRRPITKTSLQR